VFFWRASFNAHDAEPLLAYTSAALPPLMLRKRGSYAGREFDVSFGGEILEKKFPAGR